MRKGCIVKRFSEVFDLQMGKTPDRKNYALFKGKNTWVSIRDLGDKYISESNESISDEAAESIRLVKKGTVIMSFKLTIGKCAIAAKDLYTNEAIMAFNVNEGYDINPSFLYYYLQGYQWEGANKAVMGVTLNKTIISQQKISIPPKETQLSIVSELDQIHELLRLKKAQLRDYDNLAQSLFYEMFGDPVENEMGWEVKKLGEIGNLASGGTPNRRNPDYFRGDINWFSAGELNSLYLVDSKEKITQEALDNSAAKLFSKNSLLIGMYDTAAFKLGILTKQSSSNQACANLELFSDDIVWMYYNLTMLKEKALSQRRGIRQKNLNLGFIRDFLIPLPPLPLQQLFATRVEALERQKAEVQKAIDDLETLLAARMQHWFE